LIFGAINYNILEPLKLNSQYDEKNTKKEQKKKSKKGKKCNKIKKNYS
jgi:hypothetical protein